MQTRAARLHGPSDLRLEFLPVPDLKPDEVLVDMSAAGICGSDLHYYHDGGYGPVRIKEPVVLGHEAAGRISALGDAIKDLSVGDRVALNPSLPCGACKYCEQGLSNQCLNMRFFGSAMRFPHEQGCFRDRIVVPAVRCVKVAEHVSITHAACSEPLAVCLHACAIAGDMAGRKILVTGSGPIGVLCAALAAKAGAAEVVVTDLQDLPLEVARKMGATAVLNAKQDGDQMRSYTADRGYFDICLECTAAPPAIRFGLEALKPRGTFVQVGLAGDTPVPLNLLVSKEIKAKGTFRFQDEFPQAVAMINAGQIDMEPMITQHYALEDYSQAFEIAGDRTKAVKVLLGFD